MNSKLMQRFTHSIFILSGIFTLVILIAIVGFILINGIHVMDFEFLFTKPLDSGKDGGIFPMILSSLYLIVIVCLIAIPLGVGSSIYMSEYASNKNLIKTIIFISAPH